MPIVIKDFSWKQTERHVLIKIPLKGVHRRNVDILTTRYYVKAFYKPYIFELFPWKAIDDTSSTCFITDVEVIFELRKLIPQEWTQLEAEIDNHQKMEFKKKYLADLEKDEQEKDKVKRDKKAERKREAVKEQIAIDTKFRNSVEQAKKQEKEKALAEIHAPEKSKVVEKKVVLQTYPKTEESPKKTQPVVIPLPRKPQSVNISHTTREFTTPSRESKAEEELEWLTKQQEARRTCGFIDEDLKPEERNPQWLKDKGDELFKIKNYIGAISAYSTGIKVSPNYVPLYINRSAAHLALGNLRKTINDCSTALDLMVPICQANLKQRAKCLARRGAALCQLGMKREGAGEIEAALKLLPNDKELKRDLENIKQQIEESK